MHSDFIVVSLIEGLAATSMTYSVVNELRTNFQQYGSMKVDTMVVTKISNCSLSLHSQPSEISVELLLLECALKVLLARQKGQKDKKCHRLNELWWTTSRMCSERVVGVPKKTKSTKNSRSNCVRPQS